MKRISALLVVTASSGCAAFATQYVEAGIFPQTLALSGNVQTAQDGDVLFQQPARASGGAKLNSALKAGVLGGISNHMLDAGEMLYRVTITGEMGQSFCTVRKA